MSTARFGSWRSLPVRLPSNPTPTPTCPHRQPQNMKASSRARARCPSTSSRRACRRWRPTPTAPCPIRAPSTVRRRRCGTRARSPSTPAFPPSSCGEGRGMGEGQGCRQGPRPLLPCAALQALNNSDSPPHAAPRSTPPLPALPCPNPTRPGTAAPCALPCQYRAPRRVHPRYHGLPAEGHPLSGRRGPRAPQPPAVAGGAWLECGLAGQATV
jgi:hypothetical protein